jgi:hypothetical protein
MATTHQRLSFLELPPPLVPIYRAIACEIEELCNSISEEAEVRKPDLQAIAAAMADRRHLISWLRRLGLPPASAANDTGITPEVEQVLLAGACEQECDQ